MKKILFMFLGALVINSCGLLFWDCGLAQPFLLPVEILPSKDTLQAAKDTVLIKINVPEVFTDNQGFTTSLKKVQPIKGHFNIVKLLPSGEFVNFTDSFKIFANKGTYLNNSKSSSIGDFSLSRNINGIHEGEFGIIGDKKGVFILGLGNIEILAKGDKHCTQAKVIFNSPYDTTRYHIVRNMGLEPEKYLSYRTFASGADTLIHSYPFVVQ
jgi:hypothetical protein